MVGFCLNCGTPLPPTSRASRKFCKGDACRVMYHRRRHNPSIAQRHQVPPAPSHTPDPDPPVTLPDDLLSLSQPEILKLRVASNITAILLKAKLDLDLARRRIRELEETQQGKEVTVLDPDTARRAARLLAQQNYAS